MYNHIKAVCLTGILWSLTTLGMAQEPERLQIGDRFPMEKLATLLGPHYQQASFGAGMSNKALLIDFWNIWCHSCWSGMPKLEALQQQYADELTIIKVTANRKEEVAQKHAQLKRPPSTLFSITDDSVLLKQFPHLGDPLHVWVDKKGIIQQITYGHNATAENMRKFLNGEPLDFAKRGDLGTSDYPRSLLQNAGRSLTQQISGYSLLVKGNHEYASLKAYENPNKSAVKPSVYFTGVTLMELYRNAYFKELYGMSKLRFFESDQRICLEVKDSTPFFQPRDSNQIDWWNSRYLFNYESYYSARLNDPMQILQQDLERNVPYKVSFRTQPTNCLVLVWKPGIKTLQPVHRPKNQTNTFSLQQGVFDSFFKMLMIANQLDQRPLLNDVRINQPVSISITSKLDDLPSLRKELHQYGLDLVQQVRPVQYLVIQDR